MKIRIEIVDDLIEDEVLVRCGQVDEKIKSLEQFIMKQSSNESKIIFYKQSQEFYFPVNKVLFFETDNEQVFAHTADDDYKVKFRLYELDDLLPKYFVRASKSSIVNTLHVLSLNRNLTASSLMNFSNSHKHVFVSRHYYKNLREAMNERGRHIM